MKKIVCMLSIGVLLVGCGSSSSGYNATVTGGEDVVIEGSDISVTKNDVYEYLLDQYGSAKVLDMALNYIADQEITDTDAVQSKLDETIAQYSQYMEGDMDSYAKQLGYADATEYTDFVLRPSAKKELLKTKYIDENIDDIIKEYKVKYLKTITLDTESAALKIIEESTSIDAFNTLLAQNGDSGEDLGMVTKESTTLDENLISSLDKFTKDGIYSKVIKTSTDQYVVVYVYNSDIKDLKEDIKTNIAGITSISSDYEVFYLKKYEFKVYESKIKEEIETLNENYIG